MKPKLQIALDNLSLEDALKTCEQVGKVVDIIEVGTILAVAASVNAVSEIRSRFPDKLLVADIKVADAGGVIAKQCFDAGANFMTTICCADIATMTSALEVAKKYDDVNDIQIELYGDWTFEQAEMWYNNGLRQAIYHRSRDAQKAGKKWDDTDMSNIKKLIDMGFDVTVTGGIAKEDLVKFKDMPIYGFIAGRSIRDAEDPTEEARMFQREIENIWS